MKGQPVGWSDVTILKWDRLGCLLDIHLKMVKAILSRTHDAVPAYIYIDPYSGPGMYGYGDSPELAGHVGSPLIAIRRAKAAGIPIIPWLADSDRRSYDSLRASLLRDGHPEFADKPWLAPCCTTVDRLLRWPPGRNRYGMAFVDPNGYPDWAALELLTKSPPWHCLDLLINVNSTVHKRCLKISKHDEDLRPTEHLGRLNKRYISLWIPSSGDPHQFCLAYCTNQKYIEFAKQGFHGIRSTNGQLIGRLIDFTAAEREDLGPIPGMLPGLDLEDALMGHHAVKEVRR